MSTIEADTVFYKILGVLREAECYRSKGRYITLPGLVAKTGIPADILGDAIDANHDKVYMFKLEAEPNELFVALVEDQN